jgi:hypothetical protein
MQAHGDIEIVIALILPLLAIVLYGIFIASQHCASCMASIADLPDDHFARGSWLAFGPLYVPLRCPSCQKLTRW